jgi:hypothetical protein
MDEDQLWWKAQEEMWVPQHEMLIKLGENAVQGHACLWYQVCYKDGTAPLWHPGRFRPTQFRLPWGGAFPPCRRGACAIPIRAGSLPPHAGIDVHTHSGSLGLVAGALP